MEYRFVENSLAAFEHRPAKEPAGPSASRLRVLRDVGVHQSKKSSRAHA